MNSLNFIPQNEIPEQPTNYVEQQQPSLSEQPQDVQVPMAPEKEDMKELVVTEAKKPKDVLFDYYKDNIHNKTDVLERGYTVDAGGPTMYGVATKFLPKSLAKKWSDEINKNKKDGEAKIDIAKNPSDIKNISKDMASEYFYTKYYKDKKLNELPSWVDEVAGPMIVNAEKDVPRALNVLAGQKGKDLKQESINKFWEMKDDPDFGKKLGLEVTKLWLGRKIKDKGIGNFKGIGNGILNRYNNPGQTVWGDGKLNVKNKSVKELNDFKKAVSSGNHASVLDAWMATFPDDKGGTSAALKGVDKETPPVDKSKESGNITTSMEDALNSAFADFGL